MRKQVRFYVKRKMLRAISETQTLHEFAGMSGLRSVLDEVGDVKQQLALLQSSLADIVSRLHNPRSTSRDGLPYMMEWVAEREAGDQGGRKCQEEGAAKEVSQSPLAERKMFEAKLSDFGQYVGKLPESPLQTLSSYTCRLRSMQSWGAAEVSHSEVLTVNQEQKRTEK